MYATGIVQSAVLVRLLGYGAVVPNPSTGDVVAGLVLVVTVVVGGLVMVYALVQAARAHLHSRRLKVQPARVARVVKVGKYL